MSSVIKSIHNDNKNFIVTLSGSVAMENYSQIQSTVEEAVNNDPDFESLIFDLDEVNYVSSAGLRMFSYFSQLMLDNGKGYHLINLDPMLRKMFMLTGYASSYDIKEKKVE